MGKKERHIELTQSRERERERERKLGFGEWRENVGEFGGKIDGNMSGIY